MNTITLRRGKDGKRYPDRPLTRAERNRARWLAHHLVHHDGLSIRKAQQVMLASYGVRRSTGIIAADLRNSVCADCCPETSSLNQPTYHCPHCPDVNT